MANNNHFNLTLDTLAPTGSITRPQEYIKENTGNNLTITKNEDAVYMKVWYDTYADGYAQSSPQPTAATFDQGEYYTRSGSSPYTYTRATAFDSTATYYSRSANYSNASWEAATSPKQVNFAGASNNYYYHLILMDSVNNESQVYSTDVIIWDVDAPTIPNTQANHPYMADPDTSSQQVTNNLTGVVVYFGYSDGSGAGVSGVTSATITGDDINTITLTNLSASSTYYSGTLDFKPGTQDGTKTIYITVTDNAGNTSSPAVSASIVLDTALDSPTLVLETTGGSNLPPYINYSGIVAHLTSTDTDIVGYKIWEGDTEPSTWDDTGIVSGQALDISKSLTLTSSNGLKTIHAKVKDSAGTVASATDATVTYDNTAPTNVTVTSNKAVISDISGFDTATLTLTGSDNLGVASYSLTCNGTPILSGNITEQTPTLPTSFSLTSANSMQEGSNTIVWTLVDKAGNSTSSTDLTITLDTTAPTAEISPLNTWYNSHFGITVTLADNGTVSGCYAWVSSSSSDTTVPQGAQFIATGAGNILIDPNEIYWGTLPDSATNYMHVKVLDTVGNAGYEEDVTSFGYDTTAPSGHSISFSSSAYTSTSAAVEIHYGQDLSGLAGMRVTGDITNGTANDQWEPIPSGDVRSVTLTSGDGMKSVYLQLKDNAGNVSALSAAAQCELDQSTPTASLALYDAANTATKPAVSPLATFTARITIEDSDTSTDPNPKTYYKLWGDFTSGSQQAQGTTEPEEWTEFIPDSGQIYKSITGLYCTSGDGTKQIKLKAKDSAGNQPNQIIVTFVYDTSLPEVVTSGWDYNIVSKVHILRRDSEGPITGHYADECNFVFTPNEEIKAWKICAYADATAAAAGSHADTAIPSTAGSVNMIGTSSLGNVDVNCLIKGADFETALGGTGHDGAHIVVVYVQDLADQWSAAASFSSQQAQQD